MSTFILNPIKTQFNLRIYDESVSRIEKVLEHFSEEEVWYKPNHHANSAGHLILHLCGNVTQWIGTGIGTLPDLRERDLEFNTTETLPKKVLISKLRDLRAITDQALATLTREEDLLLPRSVQGYNETGLSIIIHVIEHFSYHTGQIALIAKYLKSIDLGFYAGKDLNAKS